MGGSTRARAMILAIAAASRNRPRTVGVSNASVGRAIGGQSMRCAPKIRFAADSPLEETGFEPLVPSEKWTVCRASLLENSAAQAVIAMENACKRGFHGGRGK